MNILTKELNAIREKQRRLYLKFERENQELNERINQLEEIAQKEQTEAISSVQLQVLKANLRRKIKAL